MPCKYYGTRNKADFDIEISQKQYSENLIIYVCIHAKNTDQYINIVFIYLFYFPRLCNWM